MYPVVFAAIPVILALTGLIAWLAYLRTCVVLARLNPKKTKLSDLAKAASAFKGSKTSGR